VALSSQRTSCSPPANACGGCVGRRPAEATAAPLTERPDSGSAGPVSSRRSTPAARNARGSRWQSRPKSGGRGRQAGVAAAAAVPAHSRPSIEVGRTRSRSRAAAVVRITAEGAVGARGAPLRVQAVGSGPEPALSAGRAKGRLLGGDLCRRLEESRPWGRAAAEGGPPPPPPPPPPPDATDAPAPRRRPGPAPRPA